MSNKILIIGTGKYKDLAKGQYHYEIPEMAELLVKKGFAVYEGDEIEEVVKEKIEIEDKKEKKQIKKPQSKKSN